MKEELDRLEAFEKMLYKSMLSMYKIYGLTDNNEF